MTTSIVEQLASAFGRKDQAPNIALAEKISDKPDTKAILELITLLMHKTSLIRHDAIKVLYEIGERKPELIIPHTKEFLTLLDHKDNWMKWGAMTALSVISKFKPEILAGKLTKLLDAMDRGSVITRDHGIEILCQVGTLKKQYSDCIELLLEQLQKAPVNQVPMYAEKIAMILHRADTKRFEKILLSRKDVLEIPTKQKRIEKLLKKLNAV